eukprot:4362150-Karenia_brevis.AAC.1
MEADCCILCEGSMSLLNELCPLCDINEDMARNSESKEVQHEDIGQESVGIATVRGDKRMASDLGAADELYVDDGPG